MKNVKANKAILLIIAALALFRVTGVLADNINDFINQARLHRDEVTKEVVKNNNNFLNIKKTSMQKMGDYQTAIETIKNKHQNKLSTNKEISNSEKAIVFVSFSMPELSLKQIIYDASRYQVPVVIRGLYKNSFRKTVEKIFELIKENNKGGIAINPRWFKEYEIKAVPAVVVNEEYELKVETKKSDVVYGNIPLKKALEIIAERGEASNTVRDILHRSNK